MRFTNEDREMVALILKHFESDLHELQNDRCGHSEIVSDLKESCREKICWLEVLLKRIEQGSDVSDDRFISDETYAELVRLGIIGSGVRSHNCGNSDYSSHLIQPWSVWLDYGLNPWDADIVKRVLRTKDGEPRSLDYEKIIHICEERLRQLGKEVAV